MSDYFHSAGIDIAKKHFSIHAIDSNSKVLLHKFVTRAKLLPTIANMPPMRTGLEACGEASLNWRGIGSQTVTAILADIGNGSQLDRRCKKT